MVRLPVRCGARFSLLAATCAALALSSSLGGCGLDDGGTPRTAAAPTQQSVDPASATSAPTSAAPASSTATPTIVDAFPGWDVTPIPGATPDTSKAFWYIPYLNEAIKSPIFDGTIAGIRIGSGVDPGSACNSGRTTTGTPADASGTPVDPESSFKPDGIGGPERVIVGLCDGKPVLAEATYLVSADPTVMRFGGDIQVYRHFGAPIVVRAIPSDRWSESTIAGHPAAVAQPILPDIGLGESAVIVYVDGIVTSVQAVGIPWPQVLQFAAGLFDGD